MKPDDKKHRDKARLDRKKEAGLAARTARKEARAVAAAPLQGDDAKGLIEAVRHQRGERRRHAFLALAELDQAAAVALVEGLLDDAQGRNREELGRLLLWRGGPHHVDAILAGRAGDIVVAGFATSDVVVDAATRLLPEVQRLTPSAIVDRLRRLGVAPLVDAAVEGIGARAALAGLLVAALHHPRRHELSTSSRDAMIDALLRVSPDTLWTRCRDVLVDDSADGGAFDPRLQLAGLAAGVELDHTAGLLTWLKGLSAATRSARLLDAGLPDTARRLVDADLAAGLWRLCVIDDALPVARRQEAARLLWTRHGADAAPTLLLHPTLAIDVTEALSRAVGFEEFWDAVGPACPASTTLRDALLMTPVARHPEVLELARALLRTDPLGSAAFAVRNEAPQAVDELLQAIDVAPDEDVPWLVLGALATTGVGPLRERPVLPWLEATLARTEGGPDVVAGLQVLRRALPRLPGLAPAIDAAIERIVRRYTLAR